MTDRDDFAIPAGGVLGGRSLPLMTAHGSARHRKTPVKKRAAAALIAGGLGLATTALSAVTASADPPACPPNSISARGQCLSLPPPPEIPDEFVRQREAVLKAPPGYPAGACQPSADPPPSPDAVSAADCVNNTLPGGPPFARYEVFADQNSLDNAFQNDVRTGALQPCPGSSDSAPTAWNATNPPPADGLVFCSIGSDNVAHVVWTNKADLLKANASGPDMASLYGWWHGLVTTS